mgnify:FL=1
MLSRSHLDKYPFLWYNNGIRLELFFIQLKDKQINLTQLVERLKHDIPTRFYKQNNYLKLANSLLHITQGNSYAMLPNDDNYMKRSTVHLFVQQHRTKLNLILTSLNLPEIHSISNL